MTHSRPRRRLPAAPPNNGMQRTALRAAADAERWVATGRHSTVLFSIEM